MVDFDGSLFVLVSTLKRSKYAYMLIQNPFIGHFICHIEISTGKKYSHKRFLFGRNKEAKKLAQIVKMTFRTNANGAGKWNIIHLI